MVMPSSPPKPRSIPAIDAIALALSRPLSRRRAAGAAAAVLAAVAVRHVSAELQAVCPPCGPNEVCLNGICTVIIADGCEAFGCPDGLQCVDNVCTEPREPAGSPTPIATPSPTPTPSRPHHRRKRRRRKLENAA